MFAYEIYNTVTLTFNIAHILILVIINKLII